MPSPVWKSSTTLLRRFVPLVAGMAGLVWVADAAEKPVSFYRDVAPIFQKSCNGCHYPAKLKGKLDLTSVAAALKGGKSGPAFVPGNPADSKLVSQITGPKPEMPEDGDPLSPAETKLVARWIAEGAKDDSPNLALRPSEPPVYHARPAISAMALSPDGKLLAVAGRHEIILRGGDGSNVVARLLGDSPRIESLVFSADGSVLAACGGSASIFGEIQIWDVATRMQTKSFKIATDTVFGISLSPDASLASVGGADRMVRIVSTEDGTLKAKFDHHLDWVFATAFTSTTNGLRVLSGGRDKAVKLIESPAGKYVDDLNRQNDGINALAAHPKEALVLTGGDLGASRMYRTARRTDVNDPNSDSRYVREFDRLAGPVYAVAFSADGSRVAVAGADPEVRVQETKNGNRVARLKGHTGTIFAVQFTPDGQRLITAGSDGMLRYYSLAKGDLIAALDGVPVTESRVARGTGR